MSITLEYIRTNPLAYKNDNLTTLYNSNWYNLGHYLKDNAREIYLAADYKPLSKIQLSGWYSFAQKGPDYPYIRQKEKVLGIPFLEDTMWEQTEFGFNVNYQLLNDVFLFADLIKRNIKGDYERYNSSYFWKNTLTYSLE